jgi:Acetoacetate decarboxylase (ADC)
MAVPARQRRLEGRYAMVDGIGYKMPVNSWEASSLIAAFPCNYEAARRLLPEGDVHPFRLWKSALLVVTVIDYRQTDIGKYIEYSIAIACTKGASPAPRLLPAMLMNTYGTGQFVVDLPVSTEVSVKGGKGIWGMPKHQGNLDYKEGAAWVSAQYDLDGKMVTRVDIRRPRRFRLPLSMGARNYCRFRGMIYRSYIYFKGKTWLGLGKGSGRLLLGDSAKADWLRTLDVKADPLFTAYIPSLNGVLDDYLESWFTTSPVPLTATQGEGLETTYPLGYAQDWLTPPTRDPKFDLDKD